MHGLLAGRRRSRGVAVAALAALPLIVVAPPTCAQAAQVPSTVRISNGLGAAPGAGTSERPSMSADGRLVAFASGAPNLVTGDTNGVSDVFVFDRRTGSTVRVSVSDAGVQGNADSVDSWLSADGRYVFFSSDASNLVPGDGNRAADIFVHDLRTHATRLVSRGLHGAPADGDSLQPWSSADGQVVTYLSRATNLVTGDTDGIADVFVANLRTGVTVRVNVSSDGTQADGTLSFVPSISGDGKVVAFISDADNLVSGDTNNVADAFVHDLCTGLTERVSVGSDGAQANQLSVGPSLDYTGRRAVFTSHATNLVAGDTNGTASDVYLRDRSTGVTVLAGAAADGSWPGAASFWPSVSADGRTVAFTSQATNLVPGAPAGMYQVYVRDLVSGKVAVASVASDGTWPGAPSFESAISADGQAVAFTSAASTLSAGDTNGAWDVFARDDAIDGAAPAGTSPNENVVLNRNRALAVNAQQPAGGGTMTVTGTSAVQVPFFQYGAVFAANSSQVSLTGAAADAASITDNWHVDFIGTVAPVSPPPDAVVSANDVRWTTAAAAHAYPSVGFFALDFNSLIYRIRYRVTATVTVGGTYTVTGEQSMRV
jgi:TolB protein